MTGLCGTQQHSVPLHDVYKACRCVQVLVDGCDVKDMDLKCLRDQVGLVSQEPVLFSCSVRDNICYGNPDATQQQVEAAAQAANAHSFIQKLPEGYSTQV